MSLAQANKFEVLKERAHMLANARSFFQERGVTEIDCPMLNSFTNIDDHIDPLAIGFLENKRGFLHTSPELFLKKLLANGAGDLYFMGHVFRDHERGEHHQVEFTMVEWYRHHLSFEELIDETLDFIRLFVGNERAETLSYHTALRDATGLDYLVASHEDLLQYIQSEIDPELSFEKETKSDLLTFIFATRVEPLFKDKELVVIRDYPKEQAALSKLKRRGGVEVALRFEVYYKGVELANGYDELIGAEVLHKRYQHLNSKRKSLGKIELPVDLDFVEKNDHLPDCRGVAVGFDRLMMLKLGCSTIKEAMALL